MKIELDFSRQVITIDKSVILGELLAKLEEVIPDWKEWTLEVKSVVVEKIIPTVDKSTWHVRPFPLQPWFEVNPSPYTIKCGDYTNGTKVLK